MPGDLTKREAETCSARHDHAFGRSFKIPRSHCRRRYVIAVSALFLYGSLIFCYVRRQRILYADRTESGTHCKELLTYSVFFRFAFPICSNNCKTKKLLFCPVS